MQEPSLTPEQEIAMWVQFLRMERLRDTVRTCQAYLSWNYDGDNFMNDDAPVSLHFRGAQRAFRDLFPDEAQDFFQRHRDSRRAVIIELILTRVRTELGDFD